MRIKNTSKHNINVLFKGGERTELSPGDVAVGCIENLAEIRRDIQIGENLNEIKPFAKNVSVLNG